MKIERPFFILLLVFVIFRSRAFDVELLYIAQCLGVPVAEVPVNWQEIDGMRLLLLYFIHNHILHSSSLLLLHLCLLCFSSWRYLNTFFKDLQLALQPI